MSASQRCWGMCAGPWATAVVAGAACPSCWDAAIVFTSCLSTVLACQTPESIATVAPCHPAMVTHPLPTVSLNLSVSFAEQRVYHTVIVLVQVRLGNL